MKYFHRSLIYLKIDNIEYLNLKSRMIAKIEEVHIQKGEKLLELNSFSDSIEALITTNDNPLRIINPEVGMF